MVFVSCAEIALAPEFCFSIYFGFGLRWTFAEQPATGRQPATPMATAEHRPRTKQTTPTATTNLARPTAATKQATTAKQLALPAPTTQKIYSQTKKSHTPAKQISTDKHPSYKHGRTITAQQLQPEKRTLWPKKWPQANTRAAQATPAEPEAPPKQNGDNPTHGDNHTQTRTNKQKRPQRTTNGPSRTETATT